MSTTPIAWMIACVCLASTGCAMATEADEPVPRIEDAEDEHPLDEPAQALLAQARLEDFLSRMNQWSDANPRLDASQMVRFELRVEGELTAAASDLKRNIDPGHSPIGSMHTPSVTHVCAIERSFSVCCDPWSCTVSTPASSRK
jgi:hypothetical protein